jgi:di/tricarboxylate transporter
MGYNTNIIVHPLGGYTFTDWVVYGTPLVLLLAPVTVFSVNHFFPSP